MDHVALKTGMGAEKSAFKMYYDFILNQFFIK